MELVVEGSATLSLMCADDSKDDPED